MDSFPRSVQICQGLANLTNRTNLATGRLLRLLVPQALIRCIIKETGGPALHFQRAHPTSVTEVHP